LGNTSHQRFQQSLTLEGIKTFSGTIAEEPSSIGKTTCDHLLLNLFILIMGRSKNDARKEVMPSTTRRGADLPTRVNFSPANVTPAVKKKYATLHISPLHKMYMPTDIESELLDDSMDDEGTPDLSNPSSSETIEPSKETIITNASKSILPRDDVALVRAFMDMDLCDLDNFYAIIQTSLGDLSPIASKTDEPIVYIKDSAYEFSIKPDVIASVEKNKFYGKEDECPSDKGIATKAHYLNTPRAHSGNSPVGIMPNHSYS
jgi:hypothetical protein